MIIFQYPRCWIVSSDRTPLRCVCISHVPFSILAVGSFPQTERKVWRKSAEPCFQYPRCWIVSSDFELVSPPLQGKDFQYPRCWIVSSDLFETIFRTGPSNLSVSSLLDRFLRHPALRKSDYRTTLSVSSLLDRFLRHV